jgi:hypothetical protein
MYVPALAAACAALALLGTQQASAQVPRHHDHTARHVPAQPGQDAFGAIQEVIAILEADPATDWAKVDIEALRAHLVDMNEVTLNAVADGREIPGGLRIEVTGDGRTRDAIRRMVPAHARTLDGSGGWTLLTGPHPRGIVLTVTSADEAGATRIRALGFIGIMAEGSHHGPHHLAMAKGDIHH